MIGEAGETLEGKAIAVVSAEEDALLIGMGIATSRMSETKSS